MICMRERPMQRVRTALAVGLMAGAMCAVLPSNANAVDYVRCGGLSSADGVTCRINKVWTGETPKTSIYFRFNGTLRGYGVLYYTGEYHLTVCDGVTWDRWNPRLRVDINGVVSVHGAPTGACANGSLSGTPGKFRLTWGDPRGTHGTQWAPAPPS